MSIDEFAAIVREERPLIEVIEVVEMNFYRASSFHAKHMPFLVAAAVSAKRDPSVPFREHVKAMLADLTPLVIGRARVAVTPDFSFAHFVVTSLQDT